MNRGRTWLCGFVISVCLLITLHSIIIIFIGSSEDYLSPVYVWFPCALITIFGGLWMLNRPLGLWIALSCLFGLISALAGLMALLTSILAITYQVHTPHITITWTGTHSSTNQHLIASGVWLIPCLIFGISAWLVHRRKIA